MITSNEIQSYLDKLGWSQKDLATRIKLDTDKVNKSLKGVRGWKVEEIEAINRAFGLSAIDLKTALAGVDAVFNVIEESPSTVDRDTFKRLLAHLLTEFPTATDIQTDGERTIRTIINFQQSKDII